MQIDIVPQEELAKGEGLEGAAASGQQMAMPPNMGGVMPGPGGMPPGASALIFSRDV